MLYSQIVNIVVFNIIVFLIISVRFFKQSDNTDFFLLQWND